MEVERAQAIANVSREIINSAKIELQFLKLVDRVPDTLDPEATSKFFLEEADPRINPKARLNGLGTGKHLGARQ
jgi:hypothetical protein